jgi:Undecaprenyl-phosphate galactose phosphotransferase WbaP
MDKISITSNASFISKTVKIKTNRYRDYCLRMWGLMFFADITGQVIAIFLGHLVTGERLNPLFFSFAEAEHTFSFVLLLLLFMVSKLYPGIGINPAEEIKLVVRYAFIAFFIAILTIFILHSDRTRIFTTPLLILVFSIILILLLRWTVRILATQADTWGVPVVVLSRRSQIDYLTSYFATRRRLGFIPVLAVTDTIGKKAIPSIVPVIDLHRLLADCPIKDVETVLVDAAFFGRNLRNNSYIKLTRMFKHIIFVSDMGWLEGASLAVCDFEGLTGIEARKDKLSSASSTFKRGMDIFGSLFGLLFFAPLIILVMIMIKLDSPGPIFYLQERIGQDRRNKKRPGGDTHKVLIYKFRSMHIDADKALAKHLAANPQARLEWDRTQKLHADPRITRVGKILRKFSIDEIPQFYNVLRGEMSLVGPRPMMADQIKRYGHGFETCTSMRPGLTGLWQVSGRNTTTFQDRASFDRYYVNNWSVWLDLYILARTIWVVLSRDGAY